MTVLRGAFIEKKNFLKKEPRSVPPTGFLHLRLCDIYISVRHLCLVLFSGGLGGGAGPVVSHVLRGSFLFRVLRWEVLMFPASGVGLEADGCRQRKGFWKAAREQQMERRICLQVPSACQRSRD